MKEIGRFDFRRCLDLIATEIVNGGETFEAIVGLHEQGHASAFAVPVIGIFPAWKDILENAVTPFDIAGETDRDLVLDELGIEDAQRGLPVIIAVFQLDPA